MTGCIDQAEIWLNKLQISLCDHPGDCSAYDQLTRVRVLTARKDYASALLALSRLEAYYESEKHQLHLVEIHLLQAVCSCHSGDQQTAMQQIHTALIIGQQEGYRRLFMDEGPMLLPVLAAYRRWCRRETLDCTVDTGFIKEIFKEARQFSKNLPLEIVSHDHRTAENLPVEMLTPKESQVLKCLDRQMSNQEIAEHLGIKLSTVKSHTRNIYSKLAVTNRTQAVAAARKHKML